MTTQTKKTVTRSTSAKTTSAPTQTQVAAPAEVTAAPAVVLDAAPQPAIETKSLPQATNTSSKAEKAETTKNVKSKKAKVVRDSFTIPELEYQQISQLKKRCLENGVAVKKSELLRAGLIALSNMSNQEIALLVDQLDKIKTGRPKK